MTKIPTILCDYYFFLLHSFSRPFVFGPTIKDYTNSWILLLPIGLTIMPSKTRSFKILSLAPPMWLMQRESCACMNSWFMDICHSFMIRPRCMLKKEHSWLSR